MPRDIAGFDTLIQVQEKQAETTKVSDIRDTLTSLLKSLNDATRSLEVFLEKERDCQASIRKVWNLMGVDCGLSQDRKKFICTESSEGDNVSNITVLDADILLDVPEDARTEKVNQVLDLISERTDCLNHISTCNDSIDQIYKSIQDLFAKASEDNHKKCFIYGVFCVYVHGTTPKWVRIKSLLNGAQIKELRIL